jgi:hypothetical protein
LATRTLPSLVSPFNIFPILSSCVFIYLMFGGLNMWVRGWQDWLPAY